MWQITHSDIKFCPMAIDMFIKLFDQYSGARYFE